MPLELDVRTRVRAAIDHILADEVDPILDVDGTRYLIDISEWSLGAILWTPFDIETQSVIGEYTYSCPFAAHNTLFDMVLGARSTDGKRPLVTTTFPTTSHTTLDNGSVTP